FMRSGQKQNLDAAAGEQLPGELFLLEAAGEAARQLRMDLSKRNSAASFVAGVKAAGKDRWGALKARVMEQQARQFSPGIASHSHHSGLQAVVHDSKIVLSRALI